LGAIVACGVFPISTAQRARALCAALGLALVGYSVLRFDSATPFPGLAVLVPTIGTALLIWSGSGSGTVVNRWLAVSPLVFIGQISYSLYLLHWPVLVFAKNFLILDMSTGSSLALLVVAVALAALSWRFVEQPFRSTRVPRAQVFAGAAAAMTVSIAVGVFIKISDGLPDRFDKPTFEQLAREMGVRNSDTCVERRPAGDTDLCRLGADGQPSFLLWGDSHAGALGPALGLAASHNEISGSLAFKIGCSPLLGVETHWQPVEMSSCAAYNDEILEYIAQRPSLRTIVLASRWALFASGHLYKAERGDKAEKGNDVTLLAAGQKVDGPERGPEHNNAGLFEEGLNATVRTLLEMGRHVVLITPVPEVGYDVPAAFLVASRTGRNVNRIIAPTRVEYDERNKVVLRTLDALHGVQGVDVVDIAERLCDASNCRVIDAGQSLYVDDDHLSEYGSKYVSTLFSAVLTRADGSASQ
jgi:hypothetical protein